jgi:hypothetical protein
LFPVVTEETMGHKSTVLTTSRERVLNQQSGRFPVGDVG